MRTVGFYLGVLFSLFLLVGCEDEMPDYYDSRTYDLEDFNAVELGDALQIEILQGARFSVVAKGETDDLNDLELRVENGVLTGHYRNGSNSHKRSRLVIFMPELSAASFEAATTARIAGFNAPETTLLLQVSGASTALVEANYETLEVRVEGASELALRGHADAMNAVVGGASRLFARDLTAAAVSVNVGGASEATISVTDELAGSVQGNSLLRYNGDPEVLDVFVASDSRMSRL